MEKNKPYAYLIQTNNSFPDTLKDQFMIKMLINFDKLILNKLKDGGENFFTSARHFNNSQKHELFVQNITLAQNTLVKGRFLFCTTVTDINLTTSVIILQKSGNWE